MDLLGRIRIRARLISLSFSLLPPSPLRHHLRVTTCCCGPQWRTDKLGGRRSRPWLVPPSSPIPSHSIGSSTINDRATPFCEDLARQLSVDQSPSFPLSLSLLSFSSLLQVFRQYWSRLIALCPFSFFFLSVNRFRPFISFFEISQRIGECGCIGQPGRSSRSNFLVFFRPETKEQAKISGNRGRPGIVAGTATRIARSASRFTE